MRRKGGVYSFDMWVKKKDDWERDIPGGPRSVMSIFRLKDGTTITRVARWGKQDAEVRWVRRRTEMGAGGR